MNQNIDPTVAIVTVSYNSGRYLADFLDSTLKASEHPETVIVLVADNSSADESEARAETEKHGAIFLPVGGNRGYGSAVNHAARHMPDSVRWLLISNPDVVLTPGVVDTLVLTAEQDAEIGAVGPVVREVDGEVYPSARRIPSLRTGLGHALFANVWPDNPWTRSYHRDGETSVRRTTGWLSGACLLVRREVFDELEGFDESFFMYFEDVDLGWRLGRLGYTNVLEPAAQVVHVGAHSTQSSSSAMRRAHHRSAYRFLAKKYPGVVLSPLRLALRVGLAVRARVGPGR